MRGGLLASLVQFQSERRTPDDIGGDEIAWHDEFELKGYLRPERGREALEAGRIQESTFGTLTVRYDPGLAASIRANWRCLIDGQPWQIVNVNNSVKRGRTLEMVVQRGVAQ